MKNIVSNVLISTVLVCALIYGYLHVRYPSYEAKESQLYKQNAQELLHTYAKYFTQETFTTEKYRVLFDALLKKESKISHMYGVDQYQNLVLSAKNSLSSFDRKIEAQITEHVLSNSSFEGKIVYFYNQKFYILAQPTAKFNFVTVYPFSLSKNTLLMLLSECFVVGIIVFAMSMLFLLTFFSRKKNNSVRKKVTKTPIENRIEESDSKNKNYNQAAENDEPELETAQPLNNLDDLMSPDNVILIENRDRKKETVRNFESFVFNKFSTFAHKYDIDSMSLYLFDESEASLKKIYELYGSAFVKTPPQNSLEVESNSELIAALSDGSILVRNRSKKVIVPVFHNDVFVGALYLVNSLAISGKVYQSTAELCSNVGMHLMHRMLKDAV